MRIVVLLLSFLISACSSQKVPTRFSGVAMTIPYAVQIGDALNSQKSVLIEETILSLFSEVHQIYNNWNPESEVSYLNQAKANQKISLSLSLSTFLKNVDVLVSQTEGRFDPTIQKGADKSVVGWKNIHLEENFFWKEHDLTKLDLGGVAKGYAVDLLVERLKNLGLNSIYVEWGGEIKTFGLHPQKRAWKVAIFGLEEQVELKDSSIATSGNYLQNWKEKGKTFTHIIDPFTNKPLEITQSSITSVSVQLKNCFESDAFATALMLFHTKEKAKEWAENHGLKIWIY